MKLTLSYLVVIVTTCTVIVPWGKGKKREIIVKISVHLNYDIGN